MRLITLKRCIKVPLTGILFGVVTYLLLLSIRCYTRDCSSLQDERSSLKRAPVSIRPMMPTTTELSTTITTPTTVEPVTDTSENNRLLWSSAEEKAYPLAFSLYVDKDIYTSAQLLRLIYRPQNVYCIFFQHKFSDKAISEFRIMIADILAHPGGGHAIIIPKHDRFDYYFGYYGHLNVTLTCARALLKYTDRVKWRYYIDARTDRLPLRTNWELVKALKAMNGSNSIDRRNIPDREIRFNFHYFSLYDWIRGDKHVALRREFVHFLFNNALAQEVNKLLVYSSKSFPDELFFQTFGHNPEYGAPGACVDSRVHDNNDDRSWHMAHYYQESRFGCKTSKCFTTCCLGISDLPTLLKRPEFFFSYMSEPEAISFIEQWILTKNWLERTKNRIDPSFNVTYYTELYCSKSHI